jgi:hypothetical protein
MSPSAPFNPLTILADAAPLVKLIILALVAASLAAVAVCGVKLADGPRLAGSSTYLSSLRLGGPILGLLGAAWGATRMFIGLANVATPPTQVLARGWAEAAMVLALGLMAGFVAVIANWAIEARLDRALLKA